MSDSKPSKTEEYDKVELDAFKQVFDCLAALEKRIQSLEVKIATITPE